MEKLFTQLKDFLGRYLIEPVKNMGALDVIDILLLAAISYALYRFMRNRRAGRVMMGLLLVVLCCGLFVALKLPALSYIVRLFAAAAFFCVIVIFQPEFRDALERLGNSTLLNPGSRSIKRKKFGLAQTTVEETLDAIGHMSETHTGALIVFEGLTKLGDYTETAKPVDAAVHSHTLRSIFFDKSPLHDGALVIRNFRIYAACCVLPSTKSRADFAGMGTRHRAAVGVTEVSDALVIVVSEESGIVSVAQAGKLLRDVDRQTTRDILMTYLCGRAYLKTQRTDRMRAEYLDMLTKMSEAGLAKAKKAPRFNSALEENDTDQLTFFEAPTESSENKEA